MVMNYTHLVGRLNAAQHRGRADWVCLPNQGTGITWFGIDDEHGWLTLDEVFALCETGRI